MDQKSTISLVEDVLNLILSYYEKRYKKIEIKLTPQYYTDQPNGMVDYFLLKRGYIYGMTALANVIRISGIHSEEDQLMLFKSGRRHQVRKAIKENLFECHGEEEIRVDVWENMNRNLKEKFDSGTTHTIQEICDLKARFPEKISPFYVNEKSGSYAAFALIFKFKRVFHTQYLDVNYAYAGKYPNRLIVYELIKKAREEGYEYFSFGASTEEDGRILNYGLYNYKAGYGAGGVLLPVYTWKQK